MAAAHTPQFDQLYDEMADLARVLRDPIAIAKIILQELELPSDPDDDEPITWPKDLDSGSDAGYSRLAEEIPGLRAKLRDPLAMSRHLTDLLLRGRSAVSEGEQS